METYTSVGKNNVGRIAVDFSCEFKHLQSPEWAGQEPKKWHCVTSVESKTSQGCRMDLLCFCWQNGNIYFMKCSNDDCWFIFPSSGRGVSFISLDSSVAVLHTPQRYSRLPLMELLLTGVSIICKRAASCLREHREFSIIQILQAKKLHFKQAFFCIDSWYFFPLCLHFSKSLACGYRSNCPYLLCNMNHLESYMSKTGFASFALESNQT